MDEKPGNVDHARPEGTWGEALAYPLGCVGAILGAVAGAIVTKIALREGIYALIAVGPLTGYGARLLANFGSKRADVILGLMAAAIGAVGAFWTFWWVKIPDQEDSSLAFLLQHLDRVGGFTCLIIVVGALIAFFLAWRK